MVNFCLSQPSRILGIIKLVHDQKDLMPLSPELCAKIRHVSCLTIFVEARDKDNSQECPSSLSGCLIRSIAECKHLAWSFIP